MNKIPVDQDNEFEEETPSQQHIGQGPYFQVEGLHVHGLSPVSFDMARGECVSLLGPSGSGKSLLLRAIADLDPAPGQVSLEGRTRASMSGPDWRRLVRYGAAEPGWWAERPIDHFDNPDDVAAKAMSLEIEPFLLEKPITQLSTGERQRLALLRLLQGEPKVLLLDEPTASLDGVACARAETLIGEERRKGLTILLVTHDREQASRLADRHFQINNGSVETTSSHNW